MVFSLKKMENITLLGSLSAQYDHKETFYQASGFHH